MFYAINKKRQDCWNSLPLRNVLSIGEYVCDNSDELDGLSYNLILFIEPLLIT